LNDSFTDILAYSPEQKQDTGDHPCEGSGLIESAGSDLSVAKLTAHAHRNLSEDILLNNGRMYNYGLLT
jgi:hypothetical protein